MPNTPAGHRRWKKKHRDLYLAQKSRNNRRRGERNDKIVNDFKRAHPCVCGEKELWCLDFHHRDPSKKLFSPGRHNNTSVKRLVAEMKKCEVICANDHRRGHAGRPRPEHAKFFLNSSPRDAILPAS